MDISTQTHLNELRSQLQLRLSELREGLADSRSREEEEAGARQPGDFKDLAERDFLMHLDEVHALHEFSELQSVQAALLRLDADAYGDCSECGEPIGLPRLQRLPTAVRCFGCQQRFEQDIALSAGHAARIATSSNYA